MPKNKSIPVTVRGQLIRLPLSGYIAAENKLEWVSTMMALAPTDPLVTVTEQLMWDAAEAAGHEFKWED